MRLSIALLMFGLIYSADMASASSDYLTGNQLLAFCSPTPLTDACMGYAMGVHDGVNVALDDLDKPPLFCMPSHVSRGQLARVMTKYLNDHPELLHLTASALATAAFAHAFPCKATH